MYKQEQSHHQCRLQRAQIDRQWSREWHPIVFCARSSPANCVIGGSFGGGGCCSRSDSSSSPARIVSTSVNNNKEDGKTINQSSAVPS